MKGRMNAKNLCEKDSLNFFGMRCLLPNVAFKTFSGVNNSNKKRTTKRKNSKQNKKHKGCQWCLYIGNYVNEQTKIKIKIT